MFDALDFIAALTQHIPDKGVQMVRYYGFYSNKSRGMRAKNQLVGQTPMLIDSEGEARRIPSRKWRELIKKVWREPRCGNATHVGSCPPGMPQLRRGDEDHSVD